MKKIFKIFAIILIIIVGLLIGEEVYFRNIKIEPEDLYLTKETSNEEIKASKGSYQWSVKGIIKEHSVIADSLSPVSFDYSKFIDVKPGDKIYFNDCNWTKVSASIILQKDKTEVAKIAIESNLEEKYIVIPEMVANEYVLKIDLESDKGKVWYSAKIKITE